MHYIYSWTAVWCAVYSDASAVRSSYFFLFFLIRDWWRKCWGLIKMSVRTFTSDFPWSVERPFLLTLCGRGIIFGRGNGAGRGALCLYLFLDRRSRRLRVSLKIAPERAPQLRAVVRRAGGRGDGKGKQGRGGGVEGRGECLQWCAHCGPATTAGQLWNLKTCGAACLFSHCLCPCVCLCVCMYASVCFALKCVWVCVTFLGGCPASLGILMRFNWLREIRNANRFVAIVNKFVFSNEFSWTAEKALIFPQLVDK